MRRQKPHKRKIILGLTGSFGSGKTTVSVIFGRLGAAVIDADKLTHKHIAKGSPVYKKIIKLFGKKILQENGSLDRVKLAKLVFRDADSLARLNRVIHPAVISDIRALIESSGAGVVVLDAPLLIESGLAKDVDKLIVVKITRGLQIKRIQGKSSLSKTDILRRIKCQLPQSRKVRLADFIIDNTGTIRETERQVIEIWKELQP